MRIVAALGGNALLERGEPPEAGLQEAHVVTAVRALAPLAAAHDWSRISLRAGPWPSDAGAVRSSRPRGR